MNGKLNLTGWDDACVLPMEIAPTKTATGARPAKHVVSGTGNSAGPAATSGVAPDDLSQAGTFGTVVVDPPWAFTFSTRKSEAGNNGWRGSTDRHYSNMSASELRDLPIPAIAATDCTLWLWAVNALMDDALDLLRHWGFDYKNTLTWAKTTAKGAPAFGMGYWMRGSTEHLLLGVKGSPKPLRRNQPTWFAAPPGRHSAKPDEAYSIIETLTPAPRIDVFARMTRPGWTAWGNEVPR